MSRGSYEPAALDLTQAWIRPQRARAAPRAPTALSKDCRCLLVWAEAKSPTTEGATMTGTTRVIYTAEAHVTGGRAEGHGRTSDGALAEDLRTPGELGGPGGGAHPGHTRAAGHAARLQSAPG